MKEFDAVAYINTPRWQDVNLGLERTRLLMEKLGRPQDQVKFVHIAGTNGKGSTCAYTANILQAAGFTTGMFTSPYIEVFEERIRVNGRFIPLDALTEITWDVKEKAEEVERETGEHPTEFELMTAVALCHFARCRCDIVVMEVGLGGRLDSTNVIDAPEVCAIARIGLDHTALLGETLAEVAREKAGIIKAGASVVSYPQDPSAQAVISAAAREAHTVEIIPDFAQLQRGRAVVVSDEEGKQRLMRSFDYGSLKGLRTSLLGEYQPGNAAFAIEIVRALQTRGWLISDDHIRAGVEATCWPGRFEVFPHKEGTPWVVVDGGHNPQGIEALRRTCEDVFPGKAPWVVLSLLADKDYDAMTDSLVGFAQGFVAMTPPNLRALPAADLAEILRRKCTENGYDDIVVMQAESFEEARDAVMSLASGEDLVVVSGSLYSVGSAKKAFKQ